MVSLDQYLREVEQIALMTPAEEADLARRIKQGDQGALLELIRAVEKVCEGIQHTEASPLDGRSHGRGRQQPARRAAG